TTCHAALVGRAAGYGDARADGGAAGQQGHGLGGPAVPAQRPKTGVERLGGGAGEVGGDPAAAAVGDADEGVAQAGDRSAVHVRPGRGGVPSDDRAGEGHHAAVRDVVLDAAAGVARRVAREGATGEVGVVVVEDAAAGVGRVAREGADGEF